MSADFDSDVLLSAKELKSLGFAIHWLKPNSKAPVSREWQNTEPDSFERLKATHKTGQNIGVRLGRPSHMEDGQYLYVLDFDIRIKGVKSEVIGRFNELFPDVDIKTLPRVKSGSGGDSFHAYFVSDKPMRGKKLAQSDAKIRRYDPETKKEKWSREWEIELFGTGKQVVLPPSIHPETKKPYRWIERFNADCYSLGITPHIDSETILAITEPVDEKFSFESQEPIKISDKKLEQTLDLLSYDYINDYETWITLGQALHHQFGGSVKGFDLWMKYSQKSEKFDEKDIPEIKRTHWRSFGRYHSGALITFRSIIEAVRQNTINDLRDSMDEVDETEESQKPPLTKKSGSVAVEDEVAEDDDLLDDYTLTSKPVDWLTRLAVSENGSIKNNLHNIMMIVNNEGRIKGIIKKNLFTGDTVFVDQPKPRKQKAGSNLPCVNLNTRLWKKPSTLNGTLITDSHVTDLRAILEAPVNQGGYSMKISPNDLHAAVDAVAEENAYHPVRDYLSGLTWDKKPRVEELFTKYLGAEDTEYTRTIARLWMTAAVTRMFEPAHKFDFAPILEGIQGAGKSTFAAVLGRQWTASLDDDFGDRRRMVETMTGAWIIEIDELSAFKKSDVRAIKSFMSATKDKVRLAYGRRAIEAPRQCVFIGSTNDEEYLNDSTGGRRFWPVKCTQAINITDLQENIDQLWAEAVVLYKAMREAQPEGMLPLYIQDETVLEQAQRLQEDCRSETDEEELAGIIEEWLDTPICAAEDDDFGGSEPEYRDRVCAAMIREELLKPRGITLSNKPYVLGRAMRLVCKQGGWRKHESSVRLDRYGKQRCWDRVA